MRRCIKGLRRACALHALTPCLLPPGLPPLPPPAAGCGRPTSGPPGRPTPTPASQPPSAQPCVRCCWPPTAQPARRAATAAAPRWASCRQTCCCRLRVQRPAPTQPGCDGCSWLPTPLSASLELHCLARCLPCSMCCPATAPVVNSARGPEAADTVVQRDEAGPKLSCLPPLPLFIGRVRFTRSSVDRGHISVTRAVC